MFRVLLLILIVMSSVAFAQTDEKPQAVKIHEFERGPSGYVKATIDYFYIELSKNPSARGYIINYGTAREIAIRERQIRNAILFRRFDLSKITIVNGGFRPIVKSEYWVVPAGVDIPTIESDTKKLTEFGDVPSAVRKNKMDFFIIELNNNANYQGYIVNYGMAKQVAIRKKQIEAFCAIRGCDYSRIKFIDGGISKSIRTELWVILSKP